MKLTFTQHEITAAAEKLWEFGQKHSVWAFHAPMGAGKTTLIHALCQQVLLVNDAISSPTFAIINEYKSPVAGTVYHMDWYRMKSEEEAVQAGVEDCLLSGSLCLVEWPDVVPRLLPDGALHLTIGIINETTRVITTT